MVFVWKKWLSCNPETAQLTLLLKCGEFTAFHCVAIPGYRNQWNAYGLHSDVCPNISSSSPFPTCPGKFGCMFGVFFFFLNFGRPSKPLHLFQLALHSCSIVQSCPSSLQGFHGIQNCSNLLSV